MKPETGRPQCLIDQADHGADDFGRCVIRTCQLPEVVVVDLEKLLVEVEPGVRSAFAYLRPVNRVKHSDQSPE